MPQDKKYHIRPLREVSVPAIAHVVENMREMDRKEIFGLRWSDDPMALVDDCMRRPGLDYMFFLEGIPVAIVGAKFDRPHVASVYMFATDNFPKIGKMMTKFIIRVIIPALVESGVHRAHCIAHADYHEVHKWLEGLGATKETTHTAFGRSGDDYVQYVWIVVDRERKYVFRRKRTPR